MINPECISEKMMYNTVRIVTKDGDSCGTGSFFNFIVDQKIIPTIITNKHVVKYDKNQEVTLYLHTANNLGNPDGNLQINYKPSWRFHKEQDLCYCYLNPIREQVKQKFNKNLYIISNDEKIIPNSEKLLEFSPLEELVMIGYPIGLWDKINNYPIFRKGYTACHPAVDFNNKGIGLVDMACFPGSSGSPVFILNEGSYKDKKNKTFIGSSRIFLIGFLFSVPVYNASGELKINVISTNNTISTNTPIMTNLGYYIKSSEIIDFKKMIMEDIS